MAPSLDVLYEPVDNSTVEIDIVFVHGMNLVNVENHAYRTWTHADGTLWPRDLLPEVCPKARILLFGYNSNIVFGSTNANLFDRASEFLALLSSKRSSEDACRRHLVFVAHSLGGLVVKQALVEASLNPQSHPLLLESTLGIMFFATPHRGGNGVSLAEVVSNLVLGLSGGRASKNDILATLKPMSQHAEALTQHFRPQLENYVYLSFFETKPKRVKMSLFRWVSLLIVNRQSAVLGLASTREDQVACDADHSEICKFSANSKEFQNVAERIQAFIAKAKDHKDISEHKNKKPVSSDSAIPPADVVTHSGFDSWLEQFTPSAGGELSTDLEPPHPEVSNEVALLEDVTSQQNDSLEVDDELTMPILQDDVPVTLLISGLKKKRFAITDSVCTVKVKAGSRTRIDELIMTLNAKGYDNIYGFHNMHDNIARGPSVHIDTPVPVTITTSESRYDWKGGPLLLNENESFDIFTQEVLKHRQMYISLPPSSDTVPSSNAATKVQVRCGAVRLAITFMRTLRVPDNGKVQNAPAGIGRFPLFNTAQFGETLPHAMKRKGGLFLPMYQREAMFISFDCESDESSVHEPGFGGYRGYGRGKVPESLAIRVYVGGINVITGKPAGSETSSAETTQDYIVIPGQKNLYGVSSSGDTVQQFVALPLSAGYSVEEQATDTPTIGGLQLEIFQEKLVLEPRRYLSSIPYDWRSGDENRGVSSADMQRFEKTGDTCPKDVGMCVGDEFVLMSQTLDVLKKYYLPYSSRLKTEDGCFYPSAEKQRAAIVLDLFKGHRPKAILKLSCVTEPITAVVEKGSWYHKYDDYPIISERSTPGSNRRRQKRPRIPSSECQKFTCSPFFMGWELHDLIRKHPSFGFQERQPHHVYVGFGDDQRIWNERIWNDRHKTLFDHGMACKVNLYCYYKPPTGPEAVVDREHNRSTPSWEMGIAPGGKLRQEIFPDPIKPPYARWDRNSAQLLNIQILNSVAFLTVTGLPPPETPISAEVYKRCRLPFFSHYAEDNDHDDDHIDHHCSSSSSSILGIKPLMSVSQIDKLFQSAGRIREGPSVSPQAPATGCLACHTIGKARKGQNICDHILRPCNHAICVDCQNDLVVLTALGSQKSPRGQDNWQASAAMFPCPLCRVDVLESIPFSGPMKMPGDETFLQFVLHDVQIVKEP